MPINQTWNIRARANACTHSQKPFADGETIFTAIFEGEEDDTFVRKDYSESSWGEIHESLGAFSFWKSTYEMPPPPENNEVVKKQNAEDLLSRLIEEDEASTENARYILAIMLERKKLLRQTDVQRKRKVKLLFYEHAKSGELFIIKDPRLHLSEIEAVQDEVAILLGGKARPKPAPSEAMEETTGDPEGGSESDSKAPTDQESAIEGQAEPAADDMPSPVSEEPAAEGGDVDSGKEEPSPEDDVAPLTVADSSNLPA